jgi:hypothetical protein
VTKKWTPAARRAFALKMKRARAAKGGGKKKPRRNPSLLTLTNPGDLAAARRAFRRFHHVDPKRVRKVPGSGPPLIALGMLREVVYQPTRGARKGPAFVHKFGKGATLASTADGKTLLVIPATGKPFRVDWSRGIIG